MSSIALFWHYTSSEVQFLDLVFLQPREFVLCGSNCGSSALSTRFCTVKFSLFTFKKCFVDLKLTLPMVKSICKKATTIFSPYDIRLDEDSHSSTTTTYFCEENWLLCLNHSTVILKTRTKYVEEEEEVEEAYITLGSTQITSCKKNGMNELTTTENLSSSSWPEGWPNLIYIFNERLVPFNQL